MGEGSSFCGLQAKSVKAKMIARQTRIVANSVTFALNNMVNGFPIFSLHVGFKGRIPQKYSIKPAIEVEFVKIPKLEGRIEF